MNYAIVNTQTTAIVQGPWGVLPGRVQWPSGNTVSPPVVGMEDGDFRIVEVLDTDVAPTTYHDQSGSSQSLDGNQLTISRSFTAARTPSLEEVKEEARRRILDLVPEWKQVNLTARAVELQDIYRVNGAWTTEEQAEHDALVAAWAEIKAIRTKSDEIEAMNPVPLDFRDDSYWAE